MVKNSKLCIRAKNVISSPQIADHWGETAAVIRVSDLRTRPKSSTVSAGRGPP